MFIAVPLQKKACRMKGGRAKAARPGSRQGGARERVEDAKACEQDMTIENWNPMTGGSATPPGPVARVARVEAHADVFETRNRMNETLLPDRSRPQRHRGRGALASRRPKLLILTG